MHGPVHSLRKPDFVKIHHSKYIKFFRKNMVDESLKDRWGINQLEQQYCFFVQAPTGLESSVMLVDLGYFDLMICLG